MSDDIHRREIPARRERGRDLARWRTRGIEDDRLDACPHGRKDAVDVSDGRVDEKDFEAAANE
jgi:hypothetical protein